MPGLLDALRGGIAAATERVSFFDQVANERDARVAQLRQAQADAFFNEQVQGGASGELALRRASQLPLGINQSNSLLTNALLRTSALAPFNAAAAFGGNTGPAQNALAAITGVNTPINSLAQLSALGGSLNNGANQFGQQGLFGSFFPGQNNPFQLPGQQQYNPNTNSQRRPYESTTDTGFVRVNQSPLGFGFAQQVGR